MGQISQISHENDYESKNLDNEDSKLRDAFNNLFVAKTGIDSSMFKSNEIIIDPIAAYFD
ncbi:hypothetical protein J503_0813 [Acinetobacter baumannii 984213]|nr:hypothetical protein J503_0813 [Acinetobacter baumannii 984213]